MILGQLFDLRRKGHESKNGENRTSAVAYLAFRFFARETERVVSRWMDGAQERWGGANL